MPLKDPERRRKRLLSPSNQKQTTLEPFIRSWPIKLGGVVYGSVSITQYFKIEIVVRQVQQVFSDDTTPELVKDRLVAIGAFDGLDTDIRADLLNRITVLVQQALEYIHREELKARLSNGSLPFIKLEILDDGRLALYFDNFMLGVFGGPSEITNNVLRERLRILLPDESLIDSAALAVMKILSLFEESSKIKPIVLHRPRFTLKDGIHYDQVQLDDGRMIFISFKDGKILNRVKEVITLTNEGIYILSPIPQLAKKENEGVLLTDDQVPVGVNFPPYPIPYIGEMELYKELRAFIHKYVELKSEADEVTTVLYIMKSVLYDFLDVQSFPFIHVLGPLGHGKTRFLTLLYYVTPYGLYVIDIKAAAIKRISQEYGPILFVDEKGSIDSETATILNARFNRSTLYLNANLDVQKGPASLVAYKLFGPLVMANRNPLEDAAVESKALQMDFNFNLTRKDIPLKLEREVLRQVLEEAKQLRGKLEMFRIKYADVINDVKTSEVSERVKGIVSPRLYELVSFFNDVVTLVPELEQTVFEIIKEQILANVKTASETLEGEVALTFLKNLEEGNFISYKKEGKQYQGVLLNTLYDEIGRNYAPKIAKLIRQLGLEIDRINVKTTAPNGDEFTSKVRVVRVPEAEKLIELRLKYDLVYAAERLEQMNIELFNQSSGESAQSRTSETSRTSTLEKIPPSYEPSETEDTPSSSTGPAGPTGPDSSGAGLSKIQELFNDEDEEFRRRFSMVITTNPDGSYVKVEYVCRECGMRFLSKEEAKRHVYD
ncbi:MAG: hypothetical protein ACP5GS_03250 [Nitrososphaeria archaeon]